MALVILLLVANTATLVIFWIDRAKHGPGPKGEVKDFLVKELKMDSVQQEKFEVLREEHHHAVDSLRAEVRQAKDHLFDLVKDNTATDSLKLATAEEVSRITEKIDLITLDHFQKLRAICTPEQQIKFDELLHEVVNRLGAPPAPKGPPPGGLGRPEGPDGPPPPSN